MDGPRRTLVVLYGGRSAEHDVSRVSASLMMRAADPDSYDIVAVGITRDGRWLRNPGLSFTGPAAREVPAELTVEGEAIDPHDLVGDDTVFVPVLHGPMGEDGTVQGLLETMDVPYVGSGVLASAVAMDKAVAKQLIGAAGIPQVRHAVLHLDEISPATVGAAVTSLGGDVFVKPANMGSSVGVSRARGAAEALEACLLAARYDSWVLLEESVDGREIEVAVLGNRAARASLPGEITPAREFYDYEDKYVDGAAELTVPARLTEKQTQQVRDLALRAYAALRCEGMARVDFFLEENGRGFLCNEVNTIPGFTPISMYPRMWEASGVPHRELVDELVSLALERHASRRPGTGR
ncbi:MAG: D-alanine--D-alanine ligase family protein [Ilumatobacteraceae bacterium]